VIGRENAAKFISETPGVKKTGILYNGEVDGVAGAVIINKALKRLGADTIALPVGKGLNAHSPETKHRLAELDLARLVVVDSGSREGPVLSGVPALVIDHHKPLGKPEVEVFFNTHEEDVTRPSSLAAYDICGQVVNVGDLDWVAALGILGDLGPRAPFSSLRSSFKKYGRKNLIDLVVLINSGQRHRDYEVKLAYDVLFSASGPSDITGFKVEGSSRLEQMRKEVQDEF